MLGAQCGALRSDTVCALALPASPLVFPPYPARVVRPAPRPLAFALAPPPHAARATRAAPTPPRRVMAMASQQVDTCLCRDRLNIYITGGRSS